MACTRLICFSKYYIDIETESIFSVLKYKRAVQNIVLIACSKHKMPQKTTGKNVRMDYQFGFLYDSLVWLNNVQQNHRAESRTQYLTL